MESILTSIKKLIGIEADDTYFDPDLIIHINSVIATLYQMGVGPEGFQITGANEVWTDYLSDVSKIAYSRSYIALKVKALFDPSSSSAVMQSMNEMMKEYEWRLYSEKNF